MGRTVTEEELFQTEYDLLGIVFNFPDVLDVICFEKEYFKDAFHQKIFEYFSKERKLDIANMLRFGFEMDECKDVVKIMTNCSIKSEYETFAKSFATIVLDKYKDRTIDDLNLKRSIGIISRQEWFDEFNRVENLVVEKAIKKIEKEEVKNILTANDEYIKMIDFPKLSRLLKIETTDVVTVAGSSGFGKSTFILNTYEMFSRFNDKYKCQLYNLEVSEKMMFRRLFNLALKKHLNISRDELLKDEERLDKFLDQLIYNNDSFINTGSLDFETLRTLTIQNLDKDRINIVFVDHIGLLSTQNKNHSKSEYDRITYCMQELRKMALDYKIVLFVVSQFDRASVKSGNISMHSLKSSGEIENSSTHVLLLKGKHREIDGVEDRSILDLSIDVGKNRNGPTLETDHYTFYKDTQLMLEDR